MKKIMKVGCVLGALVITASGSLYAQTSSGSASSEIATKGPFAQRSFARVLGSPVTPASEAQVKPMAGKLEVDQHTGESNELIVTLKSSNGERMAQFLPGSSKASPAPDFERKFVNAIKTRSPVVSLAFGSPMDATFLIGTDRMSDEKRIAAKTLADRAGKRDPREALERMVVLRYNSIELAKLAMAKLRTEAGVESVELNRLAKLSYEPTDPYFKPVGSTPFEQYQWGMYKMNFPAAWDAVPAAGAGLGWTAGPGNAYIGILDSGYGGVVKNSLSYTIHKDLQNSVRPHLMSGLPIASNFFGTDTDPDHYMGGSQALHAIHVAGIVGAQHNNNNPGVPGNGTGAESNGWVAGGCPGCSLVMFPFLNNSLLTNGSNPYALLAANVAIMLTKAADTGMQVVNYSGGIPDATCSSAPLDPAAAVGAICSALEYFATRDMLLVEATGNSAKSYSDFPSNVGEGTAYGYNVLPVGGVASSVFGATSTRWYYGPTYPGSTDLAGSNNPGFNGVAGPAKSVASTFQPGLVHRNDAYTMCADNTSASYGDESSPRYSNGQGDGVGSCTGTSMAAPHVSALAGLIRSVNPRLSATQVRAIIKQSGDRAASPTADLGYGVPNAATAVTAAIATNPTKLTPLFSMYSGSRLDSFYTSVPQMGAAAMDGWLTPRASGPQSNMTYANAYGSTLTGYNSFPRFNGPVLGGSGPSSPLAEVWVFTTASNPKSASVPLTPLIRMSWKCGDWTSSPPAICSSVPYHIDTVMVAPEEVEYFSDWLGYKVDGTEGYIYPKSQPQPPGTVKLMRKYNAANDDHAAFPDTALGTMNSRGFTSITNATDWIGYVYPNSGSIPTIQ